VNLGSLGLRPAEPLYSWHQSQVAPAQANGKGSRFTNWRVEREAVVNIITNTNAVAPRAHIHLSDAAQEARQEPQRYARAFHRGRAKRWLSSDPSPMGGHAESAEPHLRLQDRRVSGRFRSSNATVVANVPSVALILRSSSTKRSTSASFRNTTKQSRSP
jgi:hypothetical protein